MTKTWHAIASVAIAVLFGTSAANADIAVNIDVPDGRGDGDAAAASVADFISQNPLLGLDAGADFLNSGGNGFGNGAGWSNLHNTSLGGLTFDLNSGAGSTGGNGFNAGDASHNDLDPITENYAFNVQGQTLTISGFAALTNAGDTIGLGLWGIGDNINQSSIFTVTYDTDTSSQETFYNGSGEARNSAVGSVPFVNFFYTADGVTDSISIDIDTNTAGGTTVFNGFAVSITAVPEPATGVILGAFAIGMVGFRRRS